MYATWIRATNLRPLLDILARMCSAPIDDDDLLAIRAALKGTDDEHDQWFRYELSSGAYRTTLEFARDAEQEDVIHVRVSAPRDQEARIIVAMDIANSFQLVGPTVLSE